ncbi:MAG TPA: precorrin-4 C(11)-methyltransferase [Pseudonocardiaceae bacterium]
MNAHGRVSFIGAGPGAADLITLRGARRIAEADIVVWAASLVDPDCIKEHARPDAEIIDSSLITHEDVLEIFRRAMRDQKRVARVHSGDPSLWGAVQEQYDACLKIGVDVEIVPGVSAFSAVAATVGRELTVPEVAQSVILTRLEGGKTPMPDGEQIREFARHGTTMAIFLSAARSGQLVEELLAGGYEEDTPVVVAYKATWPDELILHTTIGELVDEVKQHKLWRHTLFLVGRALRAGGTRSHLYNAGHFHTYRKADPAARRALRASRAGESATDEGEPAPKTRAGWPLHTSRSGWVAARIANGWSPTQRTKSGADTLNGASQPASVAAWSAVQGWQDTARSARPTPRPRAEAKAPAPDQGTLELGAESEVLAPEVAEVTEVAAQAVVEPGAAAPQAAPETSAPNAEPGVGAPQAAPEVGTPGVGAPEVDAPEAAEPEAKVEAKVPAQPRARAKSTGRAAPRKQTGRKPAGKGAQNRRNNSSGGSSGKAS